MDTLDVNSPEASCLLARIQLAGTLFHMDTMDKIEMRVRYSSLEAITAGSIGFVKKTFQAFTEQYGDAMVVGQTTCFQACEMRPPGRAHFFTQAHFSICRAKATTLRFILPLVLQDPSDGGWFYRSLCWTQEPPHSSCVWRILIQDQERTLMQGRLDPNEASVSKKRFLAGLWNKKIRSLWYIGFWPVLGQNKLDKIMNPTKKTKKSITKKENQNHDGNNFHGGCYPGTNENDCAMM